jgi:hypothetical protein
MSAARRQANRAQLPLLLLLAAFPGCLSVNSGGATGTAEGEPESGSLRARFEVSTSGLARGVIAPTRCDAGDLSHFLGADLVDDRLGLAVRLVVDPLYGPALRVFDTNEPYERSVVFFEEECERFELDFESTGWIVNDVQVRDLSLDVDCMNADGATLAGTASGRCD